VWCRVVERTEEKGSEDREGKKRNLQSFLRDGDATYSKATGNGREKGVASKLGRREEKDRKKKRRKGWGCLVSVFGKR
jgi:hypothetical protein